MQLRAGAWSSVLCAPTSNGDVYFKAAAPSLKFEPALISAIAARRQDCLPDLLAVETRRGWLLTGDAGPTLREVLDASPDASRWDEVLELYASLQIDLAPIVGSLLASEVPDRRPARLQSAYDELLTRPDALGLDDPNGITPDEHTQLVALSPVVGDLVQRIGEAVPLSVAHEEIHEGNVLVGDSRYVFIDWAEAGIGHPFAGGVVSLRSAGARLGSTGARLSTASATSTSSHGVGSHR